MAISEILILVVCFLVGSFPTGVVLTRRKYGIDIREMGSGNIGATNVTRAFGWYAGVLTFLIDFAKGYLPLWANERYLNPTNPWLIPLAGIAVVVGHCYSIFLKFQGGKGVATSLGCLFYVSPWCAGISGAVYVLLLIVSKVSAVGSLGGMVSALIYLGVAKPDITVQILILAISAVVLWRHKQNIRRLIQTYKERKSL